MRYILSEQEIAAIEKALRQQDRVELVPLKDGVKMNRVRREEIKIKQK